MPSNPVATFNYGQGPVTIWASSPSASRMASVDISSVAPNSDGNRYLDPGLVLQRNPTGGLARVSSGFRITTAASVASALVVSPGAKYLRSGDALVCSQPVSWYTVSGAVANGTMFRLIIGGVTVMDFAIAGFTTIAAHVADVANRVNTHPWARSVVTAVASGTSLYLFYLEKPHSSQVDISAGSVGADGGGGNSSAAQPNRPLGTIQSVNWVTNTITLAANSLIPLPVGALVGIPIDVSMVLGITGNTYLLETTHSHMVADSNDIPAFTHGCLYPARVPHWDKQFASVLPGITVMV